MNTSDAKYVISNHKDAMNINQLNTFQIITQDIYRCAERVYIKSPMVQRITGRR